MKAPPPQSAAGNNYTEPEACRSNSEDSEESYFSASRYTYGSSKVVDFAPNDEQPEPTFYPLAEPRPVEAHK